MPGCSLEHLFDPKIDQIDSFLQDMHVETLDIVPCLVVVHCDSGSEQYSRYPVVYKYLLVGQTVEQLCKVRASIVVQRQIKSDSALSVAFVEDFPFVVLQLMGSQHYHIIIPAVVQWGQ